jgi:uncharacterized protein
MQKAIGSRVFLDDKDNKYAVEFCSIVEELLERKELKDLDEFEQHFRTSRLQHCISVSYYSYRIARAIGADPEKAARAGLLHDLFYYDWHTDKTPELHAFYHPKVALENASAMLDLSEREADAILKHMWPLYWGIPKYRESVAVTLADKYAASLEVCYQWGTFFAGKLIKLFSVNNA